MPSQPSEREQPVLTLLENWTEEKALQFSKTILDDVSDGVYFVDIDRRILFWNRGAERLTGFDRADVLGKHCADNILNHVDEAGTQLCVSSCPLSKAMCEGTCEGANVFLRHKDGHRKPVSVSVRPVCDSSGQIAGAVETFHDINSMQSVLQEIEELRAEALADSLTGLGNRRFIEMQLKTSLAECRRFNMPTAVLIFDVDLLKNINDLHGHGVGDLALIMTAQTLRGALRETDSLGRIGGDEFLAVLPNATEEDLRAIGNRCVAMMKSSVVRGGPSDLPVQVSAGGTCMRRDDDAQSVMRRADENLYRSKGNGGGLTIG
jgi:diguanylate cyclase (GGDEF)-like protein/PAS domain S-box-containing protein